MIPVEVDRVSRRFGSFVAVNAVDLEVHAGEVVGLLGANGAGKTTLIKMILGLLAPSEGRITLFGERQSRQQRRRVGYVPQNLGLYRDLTVRENLEFRATTFALQSPGDGGESQDTLVGALPLGTQRRAAFTAATQHGPELLILDEPTSGVSPLSRTVLWDLIRAQAEAGVGVLVSTHHMDEAEQADRLVLMARGRVAATGTVEDIIDGTRTVEVIADRWEQAFEALSRAGSRISLAGRSVRVIGQSAEEVTQTLRAAAVTAEVHDVEATLDEVLVAISS